MGDLEEIHRLKSRKHLSGFLIFLTGNNNITLGKKVNEIRQEGW